MPTLEVQSLYVRAGAQPVVGGVSCTLRGGELVGLIGPNGAGKSTLLRAIVGAREPSGGAVLLDGRPFAGLERRARARLLAYLPQERRIEWQLRVRDVVLLGRYPYRQGYGGPSPACHAAVERALAAVDALSIAGRNVATLSGGERARVLLARALAVEAPLLLADEPIAGLDPYHQLQVMEILRARAASGAGVLAVLHDLGLAARFMDRLILLDQGRVYASGPPAAVLDAATLAAVYHIVADTAAGVPVPWERIAPGARTA